MLKKKDNKFQLGVCLAQNCFFLLVPVETTWAWSAARSGCAPVPHPAVTDPRAGDRGDRAVALSWEGLGAVRGSFHPQCLCAPSRAPSLAAALGQGVVLGLGSGMLPGQPSGMLLAPGVMWYSHIHGSLCCSSVCPCPCPCHVPSEGGKGLTVPGFAPLPSQGPFCSEPALDAPAKG